MKHTITFALVSLILLSSAKAQVSYGIRAGVNFSKWAGDDIKIVEDIVEKTDGYLTTKGARSLHVGGYVNIPLSKGFSFEPGLQYSKKGYALRGDLKIDVLKFLGVNAGAQVQSHYIDMPLLLRANITKGLSIYGGPQVSLLVRSSLNAKVGILGINLFNKGFGITDRFNRVDMGLTGGLGYKFDNGLNIQAGYDYGLTKLNKNDTYNAHNSVVKVSVGFTF
jgi:Outer membrane protein beta-barrel domain